MSSPAPQQPTVRRQEHEREIRSLEAAFAGIKVRFWVCPVSEHGANTGLPTVGWTGRVARCLTDGCGRTNA